MLDIDWWGLALPFGYIAVLVSSLYTFSTIYRKRKAVRSAHLAPWFPAHLQKNIYSSLLELRADKDSKIPDSVVRAALLRRAVEDIRRIIQIRQAKQALNNLLQRGSVGEDLNQRFLRAEKEIEEELREVVMDANALAPGWGQTIFQSANEINANTMLREKLDEIQKKTQEEKEWWEKRRDTIQRDFMKELDAEDAAKNAAPKAGSDEDGVLVDSNTPVSSVNPTPSGSPSKRRKGKK